MHVLTGGTVTGAGSDAGSDAVSVTSDAGAGRDARNAADGSSGRGAGRVPAGHGDGRGAGGGAGRGRASGTAQIHTTMLSVASRPVQVPTIVQTTVNESKQGPSHTSDVQTSGPAFIRVNKNLRS